MRSFPANCVECPRIAWVLWLSFSPIVLVSPVKGEGLMLKASFAAAFLAVMVLSPAYAAKDLCNEAHMKQMDGMI